MTNTCLVLKDLSYVLPDGRRLFSNLNEQFDNRSTGLVGRNGVGKTVLVRMMAGLVRPTSGQCQRSGSVYYLDQQPVQPDGATLADLAGVQHTLDALQRIESGSTAQGDFDAVGDDWDIHQRLHHELERSHLGHLEAETPANRLSGGEAMRVCLMGAFLAGADVLILDEPSNHLDRPNRQALIEQLKRWKGGLLVVSHDRQLLESMERIVELSPAGLSSYGGNYTFYAEARAQEKQSALQNLDQIKLERRRQEQVMRQQRERQERRQARGRQQGKTANQAKSLLDRQKERSEASAGALRKQQACSRAQLKERLREAAHQVEAETQIVLHEICTAPPPRRCAAELSYVKLPYVTDACRTLNLILSGQQRVGVVGQNGCGKSTLLRVLSGQLTPVEGRCRVVRERAYLDQRLEMLDRDKGVLEQLQLANPEAEEGDLRMRLAQLGLDAQAIMEPSGVLSGGERLKGALACVLYAAESPQLLLLDEPNNHLDLPSLEALESMLRSYRGTLVVVSHDDSFLDRLELTDRLRATEQGWCLEML